MMLKIQICITGINDILKYVQMEMDYIKLESLTIKLYVKILLFYCIKKTKKIK